ncbi:MAG: GtrA family protein [Gemmataceae bacterium]
MSSAIQLVKRYVVSPVESLFIQVPRALMVSAFAACVDVGMLFVLVEWIVCPKILAAALGYLTGGVLQYVLCSVWVFGKTHDNVSIGFVAFTLLSLVGLGLTLGAIEVLHVQAGVHLGVAKIFALGSAFVWNFFSRKYLLFRN